MILVVGSTGLVGSEICRRLVAEHQPVRALVRANSNAEKVDALKKLGVDVVVGDVRDPASLLAACQGIRTVITTVSSMPFSYQPGQNDIQTVDLDGETNLIAAAKAAGVEHFIYTSFSGNLEGDFPLRNAKRAVEKRLKESGLTYTILRPSCFMEVWLSAAVGFDAGKAQVQVYGSGDQLIGWIALGDVAAFAVASVNNPAARNCALELGGPESLSPHEVIKIFEEVQKRPFAVTYVPPEALKAQLPGVTDPMQQSFIGLMLCVAQGDPIDMRPVLNDFSISLTTVREYAARVPAN